MGTGIQKLKAIKNNFDVRKIIIKNSISYKVLNHELNKGILIDLNKGINIEHEAHFHNSSLCVVFFFQSVKVFRGVGWGLKMYTMCL